MVSQNKDVATFEQFSKCVSEHVKGVKIITVKGQDTKLEKEMKKNSIGVKGRVYLNILLIAKFFEFKIILFETFPFFT